MLIKPLDAIKIALETYTPDVEKFLNGEEYQVNPWKHSFGCNGDNGKIDGAGEIVRICKRYGLYIYPGANTIMREYTLHLQPLLSDKQLEPGMLVFKVKHDGEEPLKYRNDGFGNVQKIGIIIKTKPSLVLYSQPYNVKIESRVKNNNWTHFGYLKYMDFEEHIQVTMFIGTVLENISFKEMPYNEARFVSNIKTIQKDEKVTVLDEFVNGWYMIEYKGIMGYVEKKYIK